MDFQVQLMLANMFSCDYKTIVFITIVLNHLFYEYCGSESLNTNRKFVVRKDLSDFCRRGVISSVFLGTHVVEANSQILQFSKRESDYSCRFCVRTEYGNNIIMVIRNKSDKDLSTVCGKGSRQIVVYNMGETFGGYWAAMPEFMRETGKYPTGVYTIGTTTPTPTTVESESESDEDNDKEKKVKHTKSPVDDYISIEIPIVNISVKFPPGEKPAGNLLDVLLDVEEEEPVLPGGYVSTVIPLLNFSVWDVSDEKQLMSAIKPVSPKRYQYRSRAYGYDVNKRLSFKKLLTESDSEDEEEEDASKHVTTVKGEEHRLVQFLHDPESSEEEISQKPIPAHTEKEVTVTEATTSAKKFIKTTMNILNPFMHFDKTQYPMVIPVQEVNFTSTTKLAENKTESTKRVTTKPTTVLTTERVTKKTTKNVKINSTMDKKSAKIDYFNKVAHPVELLTDKNNGTSNETTTHTRRKEMTEDRSTNPSVPMVDHESWENVVIGAPKMMENLNKTSTLEIIDINHDNQTIVKNSSGTAKDGPEADSVLFDDIFKTNIKTDSTEMSKVDKKKVKKRQEKAVAGNDHNDISSKSEMNMNEHEYVTTDINDEYFVTEDHEYMDPELEYAASGDGTRLTRRKRMLNPLSIRNVFPRAYNTAHTLVNMTPIVYEESNIEKIERHVELQNDKVNSRISIRYETLFLGDELFNLCTGTSLKTKHVFLFNTSRIMIELENFVLDMVTIVLTEGRTVSGTNCEENYLECQLAGNRVCIDAMNACDGVPNCGADDIYDEDRLKCGYLLGIQHDVYLAAITFLVLILTLLYVVHYWLKRCVPKVSSAFFIYTEGAEIKLNLRSIMRSPIDEDFEYHEKIPSSHHILDYDPFRNISEDLPSFWQRLKKFCCFYIRKPKHIDGIFSGDKHKLKKSFSFAEAEIGKLYKKDEMGVQTSLEMAHFKQLELDFAEYSSEEFKEMNELNVLNFCRDSVCKECTIATNTDMPIPVLKQQPQYRARSLSQQCEEVSTDFSLSDESNQLSQRALPGSIELAMRDRGQHSRVESVDVHTETMPRSGDKKLRFDEVAVTIDSKDTEGGARQSRSVYGTQKLDKDLYVIEEAPEYKPAAEIRKFLLGKNKKYKKKP